MANPLTHFDLYNRPRTEPHVSGFIQLDATEPGSADLVNELIILSPFRSGKPLSRVRHRDLASLANLHDPSRDGDQGVELARVAADSFGDRDVFGAGVINTIRVDPSLNASATLVAGAVDLVTIETADYGSHVNGGDITIGAGTAVGKKVTIRGRQRTFTGDNLGELIASLQYTGNGTAATLTILHALGKIAYSGQPADADKVSVNGVTFEFDSDATVTPGNIAVTIGVAADATFANLVTAILANVNNVTVTQDATNNVVTVSGPEQGVALVEVLDTGAVLTVSHLPPAARLQTTLTNPTDGSQNLDLALTLSQFKSIDRLAAYINAQNGYTCALSTYANRFLPSTGLDVVSGVNIKAGPVSLTGYVAAIVDWVTTRTLGQYLATEVARDEPDDQTVAFAGGATKPVTATDWENALNLAGAEMELGGILLPDTDDAAIFAMVSAFIEEQRANGKWFRAFFGGAPALIPDGRDISSYDTIAASVDNERCRLLVQRVGRFKAETNTVEYLHPVYLAAAMAGGAAGNKPYVRPLTNKRLHFAGLHPDDSLDLVTREALLEAGITVVKREEDRLVVALAVTMSRDPDRRMARIMSEVDTVDLIDAAVRRAFLSFRGRWATPYITGEVKGTLSRVLQQFVAEGALVKGVSAEGTPLPAWRFIGDPPYTIEAGVVRVNYQIFIGSEINHIDLLGRATYQRLVGEVSGGLVSLSTPVPL